MLSKLGTGWLLGEDSSRNSPTKRMLRRLRSLPATADAPWMHTGTTSDIFSSGPTTAASKFSRRHADAHLVLVAARLDDSILTGDPDDLSRIVDAMGAAGPTIHPWP